MTLTARLVALLAFAATVPAAPAPMVAQFVPAALGPAAAASASCGADAVASRLRASHPLAAAAIGAPRCLTDDAVRWVPTRPLSAGERSRLLGALDQLERASDGACRLAAGALRVLERRDRISVWRAVDTAGGLVYFGATYVAPDSTPLAVQFWAAAFERPMDWLTGAAAHEAFHALHPGADEAAAISFGERCREAARVEVNVAQAGG